MLRIEHCIYFIEVAKTGSLSKAAINLHLSQPHLSQCIKQLEAIVGVDLLMRSPKGVELTSEGLLCLEHAKKLVFEADQLLTWPQRTTSLYTLKVATFNAYAPINSYFEVSMHAQDSQSHQLYEVKNHEVIDQILFKRANIGVTYIEDFILDAMQETFEKNKLAFYPLTQEPLNVAMSVHHPLAQKSEIYVSDIIPYPLAFEAYKNQRHAKGHIQHLNSDAKQHYLNALNQFLNKFNILQMGFDNNRSLLYYLSKHHSAITLGQKRYNLDNPLLKSGEILYLPISDMPFKLVTGIVYNKGKGWSPIERDFIEMLKRQIEI